MLLEDVDTNVEGTQVHACCESDGDFNLSDMSLEPCPATADVQITTAGGDEATTTTTTSSGSGAGECCKSTTACPSDKTQTDTLDAMSQVVNVCCGEGGDASGIPIDGLLYVARMVHPFRFKQMMVQLQQPPLPRPSTH